MATKVGEAYYQIYPELDKVAFAAARRALGTELSAAFADASRRMRADSKATADQQIKDTERVAEARKRASEADTTYSRERARLINDESRAEDDLAKKRERDAKKQEGFLHALATDFRTIGTVSRGLAVGTVVLSSFQTLQSIIGGIVTSLPIASAGLAALPGLVAGAGVEALILGRAFSGVGRAIRDSSGNTKRFQQDMKLLSPAAQQFVKVMIQGKQSLAGIQQSFFSAREIKLAEAHLGGFFHSIHAQLLNVSSASGNLLGSIFGVISSKSGTNQSNALLSQIAGAIKTITPGVDHLVQGFLKLATAGAGAGAPGLNQFLTHLGDFLGKVDLVKIFGNAYNAVHALVPVLKAAGTIIQSIFDNVLGGKQGTKDVFGVLSGGLEAIAAFVKTGAGKQFEKQIGGALSVLSSAGVRLILDALKLLSTIVAAIYPSVGPLVQQLLKLAGALVQLGPSLGKLIAQLIQFATVILKIAIPPLAAILGWFAKNQKITDILVITILSLWAAYKGYKIIETVVKVTREWILAQTGLNVALDANTVGLIVLGIAALIAIIILLIKHWKQVTSFLKTAWESTLRFLRTGFGQFAILIFGALAPLVYLALHWQAIWRGMLRLLHDVWSGMYNEVFSPVRDTFTKRIPGWLGDLKHWWADAYNYLTTRLKGWWHNTTNLFGDVKTFFTRTVPGWFGDFRHAISSEFDRIRDKVKGFVNKDVIGVFNSFKNFFIKTVPSWVDSMRNNFLHALWVLVTDAQHIWHTLSSMFEKPVEWVVNKVLGGVHGLIGAWNAVIQHIPGVGHHLVIPTFKDPGPPPTVNIPGFAGGGPISRGVGGPTQDNFPILVSGGEFVLNSAAVRAITDAVGPGYLTALNALGGKAISGDPSAMHIFDPSRSAYAGGGFVGSAAQTVNVGARAGAVISFLKSIAGVIPYVFGAVGPGGYDCSGLVGEVWARLTGHPSFRRYFVTQNEGAFLLSHGFARGADPSGFTVGVTNPPEHTVGILAGHRFEAAHTGTKMRFDDGATSALSMANKYHMVGVSGLGALSAFMQMINKLPHKGITYLANAANKAGPPPSGFDQAVEAAVAFKNDTIQGGGKQINNVLGQIVAQAAAFAQGLGSPLHFANATQIDKWIAEASKYTNIPLSWVPGIKTIIQRESGGNPNAINRTDINAARGDPSIGLMQIIHSTFEAFRSRSLPDSQYDPVANIVAGVNYIRGRYGSIFKVQQANPNEPPKGYFAGGPVLVRDNGGPIPPGYSTVYNGTGAYEYVKNPKGETPVLVQVIIDGVDVTSKAHVKINNRDIITSMNRRSGR